MSKRLPPARLKKAGIEAAERMIDALRASNEEFYRENPDSPHHISEEQYDELRATLLLKQIEMSRWRRIRNDRPA